MTHGAISEFARKLCHFSDCCDENAKCWLNAHSRDSTCVCNDGWVGNGYTCKDINECSTEEADKCHQFADCINVEGSFQCKCKNGLTGNGYNCHTKAICNNDKDCDDNADCVGDRQIQYWPYYMAHIVWLGTDT